MKHRASLFALARLYGLPMAQSPQQPGTNETPPGRRKWIVAARLGILLAVLGAIAWYVTKNADDFRQLLKVPWTTLAAALGLDALIYVYGAGAIVLTVHLFGIRLRVMESMHMSLLTRFGNLLLPLRGGAAARAVYLKRAHGLGYADFLAGLSAMLLTTMAVSLILALGGLGYIAASTGKIFPGVTGVLGAALAAVCLTVVLRPRVGSSQAGGIRGNIQRLLDGYQLVSRHRPSLLGLLGVGGLQILTMAAIYWLLLASMGKPADWGILIVVVALGNISTVVQLTPGNVGVYDVIIASLGTVMGIATNDISKVILAWRVLDTALILVTGPISSYALTGKAFFRNKA